MKLLMIGCSQSLQLPMSLLLLLKLRKQYTNQAQELLHLQKQHIHGKNYMHLWHSWALANADP